MKTLGDKEEDGALSLGGPLRQFGERTATGGGGGRSGSVLYQRRGIVDRAATPAPDGRKTIGPGRTGGGGQRPYSTPEA